MRTCFEGTCLRHHLAIGVLNDLEKAPVVALTPRYESLSAETDSALLLHFDWNV